MQSLDIKEFCYGFRERYEAQGAEALLALEMYCKLYLQYIVSHVEPQDAAFHDVVRMMQQLLPACPRYSMASALMLFILKSRLWQQKIPKCVK